MFLRLSVISKNVIYSAETNKVIEEVSLDTQKDFDKIKYYLGFTTHSPYLWNSSGRSSKNFISCDAIFLDFDDGITIEEWKNSPFKIFNQIIYVSKSHQILKDSRVADRFHALLFLDDTIKSDSKKVHDTILKIRNLVFGMGFALDKSCSDLGRLIFPSRQSGSETINKHFDDEFQIISDRQNVTDSKIDELFIEHNIENVFIDSDKADEIKRKADYQYKIDDTINEEYNIKNAIETLMAHGDDLAHDERFTIACALYNYYGENGKEILMKMKESEGTLRCWNSAKSKNYEQIGIGSLFYIAQQYGFNFISNNDVIKKEMEDKYKEEFVILKMQIEYKKNLEVERIEELKKNAKVKFDDEKKNLTSFYNTKTSDLYSRDDISEEEREAQRKIISDEKKIKVDIITSEYDKEIKDLMKRSLRIDSDFEKIEEKEEKIIRKKMEDEIKEKEKELKKEYKEEFKRKKNELMKNEITDLRRYVGDNFMHMWEQAEKRHPECKIFLTADGNFSRLIKFSEKGEVGQISKIKGLEWSGVVETSTSYRYKIISGFYEGKGNVIVDDDFSEMDFRYSHRITNNPYDQLDEFYLRGEVNIQITPNLEKSYSENDNFENMFKYVYGNYGDFLLKFLSMIVFEDRKDARPTVVFTGERGTGKSLFMGILKHLYRDSTEEYNDTQFNTYALSKIVLVDEKYSNRKQLWDTIKHITGNKTVDITGKSKNPVHSDSISYFVVASNDRPIKITEAPLTSDDNQVYAIRLTKPISSNSKAKKLFESTKKDKDIDILHYFTNRIGNWLQTRGKEIFFEMIKDRKDKMLRYGIVVPITRTLLDWCETGFPEIFERALKITCDLIQDESSIMRKAIQMGFISKKFFTQGNIDELEIVKFFRFLKDKSIIDTQFTTFQIGNDSHTGFRIKNKFQFLLWLKSFLDEDSTIEEMLKKVLIPIDNEHFLVTSQSINENEIEENQPQKIIKDVRSEEIEFNPISHKHDNVVIELKNETPKVKEEIEEIVISENLTEIETHVEEEIKFEIPENFKHLFDYEKYNSVYAKIELDDDETFDIFETPKVKEKIKRYDDISASQFEDIISENFKNILKNNENHKINDYQMIVNQKMLDMFNKSLEHSVEEKGKLLRNLNKMLPNREWRLGFDEKDLNNIDIDTLFFIRKAIEEIEKIKYTFYDFKKITDIYDFYLKMKKFNPVWVLENIKQKSYFLSLVMKEFNIDIINCSTEFIFVLLYRLLGH